MSAEMDEWVHGLMNGWRVAGGGGGGLRHGWLAVCIDRWRDKWLEGGMGRWIGQVDR